MITNGAICLNNKTDYKFIRELLKDKKGGKTKRKTSKRTSRTSKKTSRTFRGGGPEMNNNRGSPDPPPLELRKELLDLLEELLELLENF